MKYRKGGLWPLASSFPPGLRLCSSASVTRSKVSSPPFPGVYAREGKVAGLPHSGAGYSSKS